MKRYINKLLAIYIVGLCILFIQTGCKEHTLIDSSFAPGIGNVQLMTDSFPVVTKSEFVDSIITSSILQNIYMGVGVIQDQAVGKTNAGLYFQVIPGILNVDYSALVLDSAFFILPYSGFTYGDTTDNGATKSFSIYGITDNTFLNSNSTGTVLNDYYSFNSVATGPFYAAGSTNLYHLKDSVSLGGVNYHPHLRIKLGTNSQLITDLEAASGLSADYPTFISHFPGLYVEETDTNNAKASALPYFQLDGDGLTNMDDANVLLYMHAPGDTTVQQFTFYFSTQYCAHFNRITRTYNAKGRSYFANTSNPEVLLQNGPGGVIDVQISGIRSLIVTDPITNIRKIPIINQAQLVFTVTEPDANYQPPATAFPYHVTTVGSYDSLSLVADAYPVSSSASTAAFINGANSNNVYTINVPRDLQLALSNNLDTLHLRINGSSNYWGAYRAIIGGGNYSVDPTKRMKFNVVYSKLK